MESGGSASTAATVASAAANGSAALSSPLSLVDLLLRIDDQQPSRKLIILLFDSLVGSTFLGSVHPLVRNANAANVLLSVLSRASLPVQIEALTNLIRICEISQRNCHVLCENGAFRMALNILPSVQNEGLFDKILLFASTLGAYHANPHEIKALVSAMRAMLEASRPARIAAIARAMQKMLKRMGHVSSFSFDASKDCGLLLPPFSMPSGGYTLCFWMRVEHMPSSGNHFRVCSLLNEEGDGLIVWLSEKHGQILINVANHSAGTVTVQFFEQVPLQSSKWYHIALSHVPKVFVFGRSEMKLYINGSFKQSKNLGYLSYAKPMSKSWIGSDSEIRFASIPSEPCICGQVNTISMYNESLPDERIATIALLSPDAPRQSAYLQGANLVWMYHPQATERGVAFDVGPWSLHAAKVGEIICASNLTVQDALFSAGGLSLLFPFFYNLEELVPTPDPAMQLHMNASELAHQRHQFQECQNLCGKLFELFGEILLSSETHRLDMMRSNGIGLLGFILEEISREHLDFQFLVTLDQLLSEMLAQDVKVAHELYIKIMLNFRIWSSTSFELQKQWMLCVIRHISTHPAYFRDKFGVQEILDNMQNYYPYPEEHPSDGIESQQSMSSLKPREVAQLRSMLCYVIRIVTQGDISESELKAVLSFVLESPRAAEVVDVLNALVWFTATATKKTYEALRKIGDISIFFGLLHHSNEKVRVNIIKIMSFILTTCYPDPRRQRALQEQIAPWFISAFADLQLSEDCYGTLLEFLLGKPQYPENADRFDVDSGLIFPHLDIEGTQRIVNPELAGAIIRMSLGASPELQIKIFQDILALLSHGKPSETSAWNCAVLTQREDWILPLLEVLERVELRRRNAATTNKDKEVLHDVHTMVVSVITSLLSIPLISKRDGWKSLGKFMFHVDAHRSKINPIKLIRTVFSSLLATLKGELTKLESQTAAAEAAQNASSAGSNNNNSSSSAANSILMSPAGAFVSAAVNSIGSLGSTIGATMSAAGAAVVASSNATPSVPFTVTKPVLNEAAVHLMFFVEEFLYSMPAHKSYLSLEVPMNAEATIDAGDAHRLLRGAMHRSSRISQSQQFSSSPLNEPANVEDGQRKWKDFALANQLLELFDVFTGSSSDYLARVDSTAFFGKERPHLFFTVLRVLMSVLVEAPIVHDVKAIREKIAQLRAIEAELVSTTPAATQAQANLRTSLELREDFTRARFGTFIAERLEELQKQGKAIEQIYQRSAERCRILLLFIRQYNLALYGIKTQDILQNVTIHVMNQLLSLFKSMIGGNDPLFLAIGGHLRGIIVENLQGTLDSCLAPGVPNPFVTSMTAFEKASPMRELILFVQETLPSSPETMERLAAATRAVEASQLVAIRSVMDVRMRLTAECKAILSKYVHDQGEFLQKSIRDHTSLAQKISLKEAQRRVSRGYAERKLQDSLASLFAYTWKLMNDCSSVWRNYLIQTQQQQTSLRESTSALTVSQASRQQHMTTRMFTKIDKSEQVMRIRAKIKKNYKGKQHTEASFTYLKSKWKKDADDLKQRQLEARKKLQELEAQAAAAAAAASDEGSGATSSSASADATQPSEQQSENVPSSPRDVSADPSTTPTKSPSNSAITPASGPTSGTPIRKSSSSGSGTPGRFQRPSLSKSKSKIVSIENEIDEMMENIDADDFTMVDSSAAPELDKNVEQNDLLFTSKCELIYPELTVSGRLDVTKTTIYFFYERERVTSNPTLAKSPSGDGFAELAAGISSFASPPSSPPRSRSSSIAGSEDGPSDYRKWTSKMFGHKIRDREWQVDNLTGVFSRRYLLNWTALELFFDNGRNYFLNFPKDQNRLLHKALVGLKPKKLRDQYFATGSEIFRRRSDITEKWRRREISNFEYLMHLNELASRTYSDLTQYPVFPWILCNYTAERMDLSDPKNYRDLRLPVGALDPDRFAKFQERFENFIDDQIPPFHYGSHYSSAGIALFFLIRMEPFTSQFICLQGGKFDYPDRLFASIPEAWDNVMKSTTDVKELTPEFFCMPEFLINRNGFDFGTKSNGKRIGDVELPRWAKTPEEFIRIQREALESEIVSQNLHHWIDLVFGYKQRGEQAIAAKNTFYYLTYEGAVDLESLWNPVQRKSIMDQIENFGQTPAQLLNTPHPQRDPPRGNLHVWYPMSAEIPQFVFAHTQFSYQQLPYNSPFFLFAGTDRIVTCNTYGEYLIHKWDIAKQLLAHDTDSPLRLDMDEQYSTSSSLSSLPASVTTHVQKMRLTDAISKRALAGSNRRLDLLNIVHHSISCRSRFLTLPDDPLVVLSYLHWDNTVQVSRFDESSLKTENGVTRAQSVITAHKKPVTCAAIDKGFLVTGGADGTAAIWRCDYKKREKKEGFNVVSPPIYTIHCHTSSLSAVAVNRNWDIVVTGSEDGVLAVHHLDLRRQDTRALINLGSCISAVAISPIDGSFVVYTSATPIGVKAPESGSERPENCLYRYSINAELFSEMRLSSESSGQTALSSLIVTPDGKYLITAGGTKVAVRKLHDLSTVFVYQELPAEAFSACLDPDGRALFVSTTDGKIVSYCKRDGSILLP